MADPVVSVIVPCRNEKDHIERCVRSIQAQASSTGEIEILVVDGMSNDGSRQILDRLVRHIPRLRVMDNPTRNTPAALNLGVAAARGRYVAILGAHTEYAHDYIQQCVAILEQRPEVCGAGGPITSCGTTLFGKAVAVAMSQPIGVGNATHRFPDYEGYADAVCFPILRKEIFGKVGGFDERLIRNQDDDFYYRVTRSGERFFLTPLARCKYFVRGTVGRLFQQYFQYGVWRVAVIRKHRRPASCRQLIPGLFVVTLLISGLLVMVMPAPWRVVGVVVPALYGGLLVVTSLKVAVRHGFLVAALFPAAVMTMHMAYGAGFLWAVPARTGKAQERDPPAELTEPGRFEAAPAESYRSTR